MLSADNTASRVSPLSLPPASPQPYASLAGAGQNSLIRTNDMSAPNARLALLEGRAAQGQSLSPVEQGELARMKDDLGRKDGFGDSIQDFIDQIKKAIEEWAAKNNGTGPDKTEGPGKTEGTTPSNGTVKGAKTIDDFDLSGASEADRKEFAAMLEYLQRADANGKAISPTAVELLAKLPKGQKVNINDQHDDSYNPRTKEINWDPRSALKVGGTDKYQSPALGFIHEVDHAVAMQKNPKPTGDGYDNTEEKRVITGSETQIAHDLGEPTRTDHYGEVIHVNSSTDHSDTPYTKPGNNGGRGGRMIPMAE